MAVFSLLLIVDLHKAEDINFVEANIVYCV